MHNRYHYYMRYITFYDNLIFIHSVPRLFQGFYHQHILSVGKEKQVPVKPHHWCPVCMTGSCIFKGRSRYFLTIVKTLFPGSKARYFCVTKKPGKPRQTIKKKLQFSPDQGYESVRQFGGIGNIKEILPFI